MVRDLALLAIMTTDPPMDAGPCDRSHVDRVGSLAQPVTDSGDTCAKGTLVDDRRGVPAALTSEADDLPQGIAKRTETARAAEELLHAHLQRRRGRPVEQVGERLDDLATEATALVGGQ